MTESTYELSINRYIAATPNQVWEVMTKRLPEWWCPKPWRTEINAIDWHAGGRFNTTMFGPAGEESINSGIFLEVTPNKRMVFTDAMDDQWNPKGPFMIGIMAIAAEGDGTRYTASARHWTEAAMQQHQQMGFNEGWSAVADQLALLAESSR